MMLLSAMPANRDLTHPSTHVCHDAGAGHGLQLWRCARRSTSRVLLHGAGDTEYAPWVCALQQLTGLQSLAMHHEQ